MTLASTLAEVRKRIAASEGKDMNEQSTKAALIDPVLRAFVGTSAILKRYCKSTRGSRTTNRLITP